MIEAEAFDGVAGDIEGVAWAEFCEQDLGVDGDDGVGGKGVVGGLLADWGEFEVGCVD